MKTKKGFTLRSLGNEHILVAESIEMTDFNRMISMNESAAMLWKEIDGKDFDAETLTNLLMENYDIDRDVAERDVTALLKSWKEAGIIED
jgi:hypothetical protein